VKKIYFLLMIIMMLGLCGCENKNNSHIYSGANIGYYGNEEGSAIIKDETEYRDYLELIDVENCQEDFKKKMLSYDADFFKEKMLIVIYHWENTGSSKLSVDEVNYSESAIQVVLKRKVPKVVDNVMKSHIILLEETKSDSYTTVECMMKE